MASFLEVVVLPELEGPAMRTILTVPDLAAIWSAMAAIFLS